MHRLDRQGLIDAEWRPSEHNRRARYYTDAGRTQPLHLEMKVEELRSEGMSIDEARREALRRFGDLLRSAALEGDQHSCRARWPFRPTSCGWLWAKACRSSSAVSSLAC
ncbi:MAG: permease prefix domain 1-containing protein [Acidobacteria bacterium]|nr:permease prefix domain 1-containing protein [Acidobacteriota bacterium]MCA1651093.1 permease prefix domain 1-containing protein [Acidobacteriota bacterium]